nr:hypothetical protein [Tanacetum cinerariifolium]
MPPKKTTAAPMSVVAIEQLIKSRVAKALENQEIQQNNNYGNGDGNHISGTRNGRTVRNPCDCTYKDFLNCKPLNFKAYGMPWKTLMKMMTDKYYPRGEIKKLEIEMWNMKVEKYVRGLSVMIQGSVMASKQGTIRLNNSLSKGKM